MTWKIREFVSKYPNVLEGYNLKDKVKKIRIKVINLRRQARSKSKGGMDEISV